MWGTVSCISSFICECTKSAFGMQKMTQQPSRAFEATAISNETVRGTGIPLWTTNGLYSYLECEIFYRFSTSYRFVRLLAAAFYACTVESLQRFRIGIRWWLCRYGSSCDYIRVSFTHVQRPFQQFLPKMKRWNYSTMRYLGRIVWFEVLTQVKIRIVPIPWCFLIATPVKRCRRIKGQLLEMCREI